MPASEVVLSCSWGGAARTSVITTLSDTADVSTGTGEDDDDEKEDDDKVGAMMTTILVVVAKNEEAAPLAKRMICR